MTSILLVDDDPQIVRAIVPALEVSGLTVTVSSTGEDAIHQVDLANWDALVVDLGLPDINGTKIIEHLRGRSTTPVVVISAQHSCEAMDDAQAAGADRFLHKPFRTPELVRCLRDLLGS